MEIRRIGSVDVPVIGMGTSGTFEVDDAIATTRRARHAIVGVKTRRRLTRNHPNVLVARAQHVPANRVTLAERE